jgi:hypothetical protein
MESIIIGTTSFLVTGAFIVIGAHIALTISRIQADWAALSDVSDEPASVEPPAQPEASPYDISPQFEVHRRAFNARNGQPFRL